MLRRAVDQYKRAIELDPDNEKVHYQLISAMAALADIDDMTSLYRERTQPHPTSHGRVGCWRAHTWRRASSTTLAP